MAVKSITASYTPIAFRPVPQSGFSGATAQPAAVGDSGAAGYSENAISRWDVVPYQTFAGSFNIGVVAYHIEGISHVAFSVQGGPWFNVTGTSLNSRTGVVEYVANLQASDFADGPIEVRAIAYPTNGVPRVLQGTTATAGVHLLLLNANAGLTLSSLSRYVSTTGNDSTGNGTSGSPYATISKAIDTMKANGGLDGGTVYLKAGTHTFTKLNFPAQAAANPNSWLTIAAAPGLTRADVTLIGSTDTTNSQGNLLLMRVTGLTISVANGAVPVYSGNAGARLWYDNCAITGGDRTTSATYNWSSGGFSAGKYMTDCDAANTYSGSDGGGTIVRNFTLDTYVGDAFGGSTLVLNATVTNQNTSGTGAHADVGQFATSQNVIWQGISATDGFTDTQGFFVGSGITLTDAAVVNCSIKGVSPERVLLLSGTVRHLYLKNDHLYGPFGLTGTLTNMVVENTTATDAWPAVSGITFR